MFLRPSFLLSRYLTNYVTADRYVRMNDTGVAVGGATDDDDGENPAADDDEEEEVGSVILKILNCTDDRYYYVCPGQHLAAGPEKFHSEVDFNFNFYYLVLNKRK